MGLTDLSTLIVALLSTVLITSGTAILWRHIFRKGFLNLFLRFFLLILCQVLALVSVGLAVNRSNGFFETWSDLFGSGTNYSSVAISNSNLPHITGKELAKSRVLADSARMVSDVITGEKSGVSNTVYLYLPHSAVKAIDKKEKLNPTKYRIVEFLTGFPSQPIMWFKVMEIDKRLATYNKAHPLKQIIGIFPQVNVAGNYDLECMNLPNAKPQAETWLSTDMRTYLTSRIGLSGQEWDIAGLSTGGWCAAMLAIKHPDIYAKAISVAGYYRPALPLTDPIALQNWAKKNYDLTQYEAKLTSKVELYLVASLGDRYSIKETRKYLALPHPNLQIKYLEIASGGHNPHVWVPVIAPALDWL